MSRNQPLSAWTPGHYPVRVFSSADPFGGCPRPSCRGPRPGLSLLRGARCPGSGFQSSPEQTTPKVPGLVLSKHPRSVTDHGNDKQSKPSRVLRGSLHLRHLTGHRRAAQQPREARGHASPWAAGEHSRARKVTQLA